MIKTTHFMYQSRQDIVAVMVSLHNYTNTFLPNALRRLFAKIGAPNELGTYVQVRNHSPMCILEGE